MVAQLLLWWHTYLRFKLDKNIQINIKRSETKGATNRNER